MSFNQQAFVILVMKIILASGFIVMLIFVINTFNLLSRSLESSGYVYDISYVDTTDVQGYFYFISFIDDKGTVIEVKEPQNSFHPKTLIGDSVTVVYSKTNHDNFLIKELYKSNLFYGMLLFVICELFFWGIIVKMKKFVEEGSVSD